MAGAVILDTAFLLMVAAPILFGVRPALHPVGVTGFAVVDVAVGVAHPMLNMCVQVVASVPCAGASATLMMAAPGLLVVRPPEVPVGVPSVAVVLRVVVDDLWMVVDDGVVMVHNMCYYCLMFVVPGTSSSVKIAANRLSIFVPQLFKVPIPCCTINHRLGRSTGGFVRSSRSSMLHMQEVVQEKTLLRQLSVKRSRFWRGVVRSNLLTKAPSSDRSSKASKQRQHCRGR